MVDYLVFYHVLEEMLKEVNNDSKTSDEKLHKLETIIINNLNYYKNIVSEYERTIN